MTLHLVHWQRQTQRQLQSQIRRLLLAICGLATLASHAAGIRFIEIPAGPDGPALQGAVWSPCKAPAERMVLSPLVIEGTRDCPVEGTQLPLVLVSHGSGGSALGHHDTATALADAGFVVAAIHHPGDNFRDLSRQGHLSAFATRPIDMRRLADYMLSTWPQHAQLNPMQIGLFGFSRGGYTGLVALGAQPRWTLRPDLCPARSSLPLCAEIQRHELPAPPAADPRMRAAVIVDPLTMFDAKGLEPVNAPIQLWASAHGGDGVTLASVQALRDDLPQPPEWHVADAGHFAFLAPCPPALVHAAPDICRDAPNFDRVVFHQSFNTQVVNFLKRHLVQGAVPAK